MNTAMSKVPIRRAIRRPATRTITNYRRRSGISELDRETRAVLTEMSS
jgi:hypothetical protein